MKLINMNTLPEEVQKSLAPFLEDFMDVHQDNIISIFVYGSATGKNFIPKKSDINLGVVVRSVDMDLLRSSLKPVMMARRRRIQAPLLLTKEHILSSLDVFPIEFLDMKENYALVYGEDILSGLDIKGEYIRLFCEQQIKGKLIRIRQAYLEVGLRKKGIEALLKESLSSLIPIFRRLLGLKGMEIPAEKIEVLKKLNDAFAIDTTDMIEIWKDKRNDERIGGKDVREVFGHYITQLEMLAAKVDQL